MYNIIQHCVRMYVHTIFNIVKAMEGKQHYCYVPTHLYHNIWLCTFVGSICFITFMALPKCTTCVYVCTYSMYICTVSLNYILIFTRMYTHLKMKL